VAIVARTPSATCASVVSVDMSPASPGDVIAWFSATIRSQKPMSTIGLSRGLTLIDCIAGTCFS